MAITIEADTGGVKIYSSSSGTGATAYWQNLASASVSGTLLGAGTLTLNLLANTGSYQVSVNDSHAECKAAFDVLYDGFKYAFGNGPPTLP